MGSILASPQFWATLVVQGALAAFVYGRLTERVASNGAGIARLDGRVDNLEKTGNDHERRISRLEGTSGRVAHAGRS